MPLTVGTQLGSHEITALLGKGGMGEVYRARDLKLKREVAIKILPEEFSRDADRVSRFQREAEVLASLNHPNIAAIHDLEETGGTRYLVLELVEGETLAERISHGPIPVEEALYTAIQICEALEAAHERGIIHRDLKPANVKITPDGKLKVLDFGLAKAMESGPASTALSNSPTMLSAAPTNAGIIIGTAAYMSPEQAKGRAVDRRTDIFAFGCVLYEMLTGKGAFGGEDVTDILSRILQRDPDWTALPANTPLRVRDVLSRCLVKDLRKRLQAVGDARIVIEEVQSGPQHDEDVPYSMSHRSKFLLGIAAVVLATTIVSLGGLAVAYFNRTTPPEIRFEVSTPSGGDPASFAISPDGLRLVFAASNEGKTQLWLRRLDSIEPQPIAGTQGTTKGTYPFWSPDGGSIGFFSDLKLKRVDINAGAVQVLADAPYSGGGTWNRQGIIVFSPRAGPLYQVPATGGQAVPLTRLQPGQTGHRFPQFLPDGQHFIYHAVSPMPGLYVGSLDGSMPKWLTDANVAGLVVLPGVLLYRQQDGLFSQPFDLRKRELSGRALSVATQIPFDNNAPAFAATAGIVAYRTGLAGANRLIWFDRSGKALNAISDRNLQLNVQLSPNGKRVAVQRQLNGNAKVWLLDAVSGAPTRFTFDAGKDSFPVWSPDSSRMFFASDRTGTWNIYEKPTASTGPEQVLIESGETKVPVDFSLDGRFLLYRVTDPKTNFDLWVRPMSGGEKPFPLVKTVSDETNGQFSPDGRWVAYDSNASGRSEIYVQPFPPTGGQFQISFEGGAQPRWNTNGKEIFFISLDSKMMAAPVDLSGDGKSLESRTPVALFPVRIAFGPVAVALNQQYAVSPDGQRFLINVDESDTPPITLIYNWKPQATK
jgi:serine/threonine protein kinase